ncbi:MAG: methyl-accepting chemotaxis protein [Lachnospiraceae bacterium]|nr:methyl-accepting chemotaxis protein [Lachnospiraceae bacterium]
MRQTKQNKTGKLSTQLSIILIPMIAIFIIAVALLIFTRSRSVIIDTAQASLQNESASYANDIGGRIGKIMNYFDAVADVTVSTPYTSDDEMLKSLEICMSAFDETPTGIYFGFSDKAYLDPSGWVPDEGYDPTTRDWYVDGVGKNRMSMGSAYLDLDSKMMVVSISREINLANGKNGVAAVDVQLGEISDQVASYKPGKTGQSILLDGDTILAAVNKDYNGKKTSEISGDAFVQKLGAQVAAGADKIQTITGNNGGDYYVSFDAVPNTTWTMVSFVPKDDVLAELTALSVITAILVLLMLIVSTAVITVVIRKKITTPVRELTDNIVHIADGDFTINIRKGGNNEIGIMNNRMSDYVETMKETLSKMKDVTERLAEESENSRNSSASLNQQAAEQSESMGNIRETMNDVANSVTELATNATELAQAVGEMTDQGNAVGETMETLLSKAKQGQKDMENVRKNMGEISESMSEMNEVVRTVDEAANKINSIVEMINAISSQTNLLSLNASIEAARAGEAGKGFAVVATEIGNLANESANATTEIGGIIADITSQIKKLAEQSEASSQEISSSSEAVSVTEQTFNDIFKSLDDAGILVQNMVKKMDEVNDIASSVAAISEEQAASTEEVTATVETATNSAENVAAESREVDQSAETVSDSAEKIEGFVDMFKI